MFGNLGFWEIMMLAVVVLLVFGAKRLPEIGSSLGKGIKEFKKSFSETSDAISSPVDNVTRQLDAPAEPRPSSEPKRLSQ